MKCKHCNQEIKETETIKIKNRYNDEVIFESKTAKTIKECVEGAVKKGINLSEADLSEAYLYRANLFKADLFKADLSKADLSEANLSEAYLSGAYLLYCKMNKKVFKQITEKWFEWVVED